MALQPCRECGQPVSTEAAACPHCGAPNATHPAQVADRERREAEQKFNRGCLGCLGLVAGAGVLVVVAMAAGGIFGGGQAATAGHDRYTALSICQQAIERQLRAPGTADYPWDASDSTVHLGGGKYRSRSYVDAQNAFGGEARNRFDCTVQWNGGDSWRVESLNLAP